MRNGRLEIAVPRLRGMVNANVRKINLTVVSGGIAQWIFRWKKRASKSWKVVWSPELRTGGWNQTHVFAAPKLEVDHSKYSSEYRLTLIPITGHLKFYGSDQGCFGGKIFDLFTEIFSKSCTKWSRCTSHEYGMVDLPSAVILPAKSQR